MTNPAADRPAIPQYGIAPADQGTLLPWEWAEERLAASRNYWVSTVRPDGRPHTMPVWGVYYDGAVYFNTSRTSRKARNLAQNPHCVVTNENGDEAVIVEGIAEEVTDRALISKIVQLYDPKYDWDMSSFDEPWYRVRPVVAFGFIDHDDLFASTATRWRFEE